MIRRLDLLLICALVLSAVGPQEDVGAAQGDQPLDHETIALISGLACRKATNNLSPARQFAVCACALRALRGGDSLSASVQAAGPPLMRMVDVVMGNERFRQEIDNCLPNGFPVLKDAAGQILPQPPRRQRFESAPPEFQSTYAYEGKSAASGARQLLDTVFLVNEACASGGYPTFIAPHPAHGRITDEPTSAYFTFPPNDDLRGACEDGRIEGMAIYYESEPGFVGKDRVIVEFTYPSGQLRRYDYDIDVR